MEFHKYSGLLPNNSKSKIFIIGLENQQKAALCHIVGYQLGHLPVRYLGAPLISSRIYVRDFYGLINKITARIQNWASKFLSYAGRLQIINSMLFSIQVFLSLRFILPKDVCYHIEQLLRNFLWSGAETYAQANKIAWKDICKPWY